MRYSASEKFESIELVEQSSLSIRRTLAPIGIPRSTFYDWYSRYQEGGIEALEDGKPRPQRIWNKIPDKIETAIVNLALEEPDLSPRESSWRLGSYRLCILPRRCRSSLPQLYCFHHRKGQRSDQCFRVPLLREDSVHAYGDSDTDGRPLLEQQRALIVPLVERAIASDHPSEVLEIGVANGDVIAYLAGRYPSVNWPAPGSEDTELGVLMEPEVGHGETEVYSRVQA